MRDRRSSTAQTQTDYAVASILYADEARRAMEVFDALPLKIREWVHEHGMIQPASIKALLAHFNGDVDKTIERLNIVFDRLKKSVVFPD